MSDSTQADDLRLIESEQRYKAVIDNASDMIQSVRPDGTFEFVNKSWLNTLGYSLADIKSLIVWDIIHETAIEHCQALFYEAVQGKEIPFMTTTFKAADGHPVPVEGNVTSRFLGDTVVATHGFFRDISERLRAEELEQLNAQLEREQQARYLEKMAALGKLSAGLAHELNNPAAAAQRAGARFGEGLAHRDSIMRTVIAQGFTSAHWLAIDEVLLAASRQAGIRLDPLATSERETAIEDWLDDRGIAKAWDLAPALVQSGITEPLLEKLALELPESTLNGAIEWISETLSLRESADVVQRSSRRISELVSAVKGYSYMDRGTEQIIDLTEGLENTLIILGHRLKNITIERDYQQDLPHVQVQSNALNQVWTNIIDNAIDAMDGRGTLKIATYRKGDQVIVDITDSGSGIAEEDLSCIFEPFYTTKPQGMGTGLGLDTAWRIVTNEHGGSITVESVPGETTFHVAIPTKTPN